MASLAILNAACEAFLSKPRFFDASKTRKSTIVGFTEEIQEHPVEAPTSNCICMRSTRRGAIGLGLVLVTSQYNGGTSRAEEAGNGWWLDGPLPVPTVSSKIANDETGTRTFLKKGIYMANIGPKGSAYRLRKYAFDLLALEDLLGQDSWDNIRRYLRQKSTFMYYDFDTVISAAPVDDKQPLTDLAKRLFDSVEKLEDAVKKHDDPRTKSQYGDTKSILQEVMTRMA